MLIRRPAFDRVGLFDETLRVGEFIEWWARAQDAGLRVVTVPEVVLRRRIHATNTGIVRADSRVDYTRALRAALQRRRGTS
jgi:GT2 family glycosyltransferase